ncbi:MAG: hypothetical protein LBC18_04600 [Opitutaceae bacterium]|nr:hypothetical protein [Opitutaceae bacterium]
MPPKIFPARSRPRSQSVPRIGFTGGERACRRASSASRLHAARRCSNASSLSGMPAFSSSAFVRLIISANRASDSNDARHTQASANEPPHVMSIMPTGASSISWRCLPYNNPIALNLAADSGVDGRQRPSKLLSNVWLPTVGTDMSLKPGLPDMAASRSPFRSSSSLKAMLDCPAQIHTSPTRTSVIVTVFVPRMIIVRDSGLAVPGLNRACHLPSAPAMTFVFSPANSMPTALPGSSQPQIGFSWFCWSTMWSPMIAGSLILADTGAGAHNTSAKKKIRGTG